MSVPGSVELRAGPRPTDAGVELRVGGRQANPGRPVVRAQRLPEGGQQVISPVSPARCPSSFSPVYEPAPEIEQTPDARTVVRLIPGPRGVPGARGPQGPQGPQGIPGVVTAEDIIAAIIKYPNAILDLDGSVVRDDDDDPVYENDAVRDNPIAATRFFVTVDEMLRADAKKIDTAITLNWFPNDGNMQSWQMVADPKLVENGRDKLLSYDRWGIYRTFSTRGPDADDAFVTFKDLAESQARGRYVHHQGWPSSTWVIVHNLGRVAHVAIENADSHRVHASVSTIDLNTTVIRFAAPRSGSAYLS